MAWALTPYYTAYMQQTMQGRPDFLAAMSKGFDWPVDAQAGKVNVNLMIPGAAEDNTAEAFPADVGDNVTAAFTFGTKRTSKRFGTNQKKSIEAGGDGLIALATAQADQLRRAAQAAVIAGMKAATITESDALASGRVNFAFTSSDTSPAVAAEIVAPVQRKQLEVMSKCTDATSVDEFWMAMPLAAFANFRAALTFLGQQHHLSRQGVLWRYDEWPLYVVEGANFGVASNEVVFFGHMKAYGYKDAGPYLWNDGIYGDSDTHYRLTSMMDYCHGLISDGRMAELTNPGS